MKIVITESQLKRVIENIINEVYDDINEPAKLKNVNIEKSDEKQLIIKFSTISGNNYAIEAYVDNFDSKVGETTIKTIQQYNENKPVYFIRFGTYENNKIDVKPLTQNKESLTILRTVFHYLNEYINKYDVRVIYFTADSDSRIVAYKRFIDKFGKDFLLFSEKDRLVGNIGFVIKKEDYEKAIQK